MGKRTVLPERMRRSAMTEESTTEIQRKTRKSVKIASLLRGDYLDQIR